MTAKKNEFTYDKLLEILEESKNYFHPLDICFKCKRKFEGDCYMVVKDPCVMFYCENCYEK